MSKKIIIIGAGPGGLTAGMILAHRGFDVTILEKQNVVGGRNAALRVGDFTFDTGPTFLHQKFTLDEVFREAGKDSADYIDFHLLDTMTRLTWDDVSLETTSDEERMRANIERSFPGSGEGYTRFMKDHAYKLDAIFPCLKKPYHQLSAFASAALVKAVPYVATTRSVMDVLHEYFHDERLRLAFTFQAKYLGMSPWKCPALFSILSYIEYKYGIYHTRGGLSAISDAMAKVFGENGGTLRLGAAVKTIQSSNGKATAVELEGGEVIPCDDLIVNADYAHAVTKIFGDNNQAPETLEKKKFSCSTFMLYLGVDKIYADEPHHHIIFADDYGANVSDIQSQQRVSDDMSVYVRNSCITDADVAPPGQSGLYVLVPTINTRHGFDWTQHKQEYRDKVIRRIEAKTGMKDLSAHIVAERIITPDDWRDQGDVFMGATFNLAHTLDQMLYLRPRNRMAGWKNIYLVGGGTHPGSGLPTIYESARISSNLICASYGKQYQPIELNPAFV